MHGARKEGRYYRNVKCSLGSILVGNVQDTATSIEKRCLSVSQMAVKASHLCRVMVEGLLEREAITISNLMRGVKVGYTRKQKFGLRQDFYSSTVTSAEVW